ncbi:MAG: DNA polymerase III subunit alpha [Aestuariivirga sp.]|uniref:DNA polymerase III subunit alpha n=1 Tax=Aestuariivirga sp. TaxID=2650926 RepID=UPI0025C17EE9|nr:DNA polymerase III subunit alpha [Aestuariivirga sp.]MCA3562505.1 DNA polymerase III subunit alpha [Aestuariivirga sp.]
MSESHPIFVHLRMHTAYSLSEGALQIKALAGLAKEAKMPAVAITDTGNLFGALEFSDAMWDKGIQPIIGCTLRVDLAEQKEGGLKQGGGLRRVPSLAFLAKDEQGYQNLMKLSSRAYLSSPENAEHHVAWDYLCEYASGLICLTGGPDGPVNDAVLAGQGTLAAEHIERLKGLFGDRLYIELQRHGAANERQTEQGLIDLAYRLGVPLVATNEPYFAKAEDYAAHDALICIAEGEVLITEERRRLTPEHYFKSQQEMAALFADMPEAVENTIEIAMRCAYRVKSRAPILPRFAEGDEAEELKRQALEGLLKRLAVTGPAAGFSEQDYRDRLAFELDVIIRMKYPGYFLIVADFIKWAKSQQIPVGPGRGSGAGSLVAYSLTITDLDPLRFKLLFERFLNPDRVSMPDFDIDFCQDRRDEVIGYVQQKYGADRVAQIITFGKLQARMVTRDVGRVLQMPYGQVDRLSKLIPNNPANPVSLAQAIESEPRLQEERDKDATVRALFDLALKLEGLYRNASTHAAGVVIGDRPLEELVPLYRDPRSSIPATQFNMKYVEKAGLVKFDFLGLKTLTVIDKARALIRKRLPDFDMSGIPLVDQPTYRMLAQGDTVGVFQLESAGMRDAVRSMQADRFEDLIALVALYRPGPMANIPVYCARKLGRETVEYIHPLTEPILKETFGVITYQEQVQQIAKDLAGYTLAEADLLRRAMGKKIKSEMDAQRQRFQSGAVSRGVEAETAERIFDACAKFAEYGFNKSHSAPYAYITYQTAWLKANHPVEFLAASMTLDMGNTDKLMLFRREAQRMGVKVIPPSVNESGVDFAVIEGAILYSLAALKNVGSGAIEHIVKARDEGGPFTSLGDFAGRIDARLVNKRALESLARAGAFDCLNPNRAAVLDAVESILSMANRAASAAQAGQNDLFGGAASSPDDLVLPRRDAWLPMERLAQEFEAVGFYLSGHPLDDYMKPLQKLSVDTYQVFHEKALTKGARAAKLAGTITHRQERRSKSGNKFAFVGFSDPTGQFEAICFSDTLAACRDLLEPGKAVIARVEADVEGEEVKLRLQGVEMLDKAAAQMAAGLEIFVRDSKPLESIAARLTNGGRAPVRLVMLMDQGREVHISLGSAFTVTPQIRGGIKAISGVVDVQDL